MTQAASLRAPLLQTKLAAPPLHRRILHRERLLQQLDCVTAVPLTLIVAPPGYGKTTLVADWLERRGVRAAWLSLDRQDSDPVRFWSYVRAALQTICPFLDGGGAVPRDAHERAGAGIRALNAMNDGHEEAVVVLDDYHAVDHPVTHEEMSVILQLLPANLHAVVISRSEPPFSVARARAYGGLLELRSEDLRFTSSESARFLSEAMELDLAADEMRLLAERTEGWPAGLRMAAQVLRNRGESRAPEALRGCRRTVADYFQREVLAREAEEVRSFVMQTCALDELSAARCAALLDGEDALARAQTLLEYLEQKELFVVPLDGERRSYRYHHLFAEAMRDRLARQCPVPIAEGRRTVAKPSPPPFEPLSAREIDILRSLAEGANNKEIAAKLFLAVSTVKWHLERIYAKLGAHSRTHAVATARTHQLID